MTTYPRAHDLTVLGNSLPPFGYSENGDLKGFSLDLLKRVISHAYGDQVLLETRYVPFARAYAMTKHSHKAVALHFARSPDREDHFKWVGPYHVIHMGLIGLRSEQSSFKTIDAIKDKKVGVVRDTLLEEILRKKGFPTVNKVKILDPVQGLKMLKAGRIDLFAHIPSVARFTFEKHMGGDSSIFEEKYTLQKGAFYFAFSKGIEDGFIHKLQASLDELKSSKKLADLYDYYQVQDYITQAHSRF